MIYTYKKRLKGVFFACPLGRNRTYITGSALLTGAVHLLEFLFRILTKILKRSCGSCVSSLPHPRSITLHTKICPYLCAPTRNRPLSWVFVSFSTSSKSQKPHSLGPHSASRLLRFAPKSASRRLGSIPSGIYRHTKKSIFQMDFLCLCSHQESNLDHGFRKPTFYPLNYGSIEERVLAVLQFPYSLTVELREVDRYCLLYHVDSYLTRLPQRNDI